MNILTSVMGSGASYNQLAKYEAQFRSRSDTVVAIPCSQVHSSKESTYSCHSNDTASDDQSIENLFHESYHLDKFLGKGASAEVFAAKKDGDDEVNYACKLVKRNGRMNDAASMQTEVTIMKKLDHPNVVKLQELFETEDKTWMVMELANGGELMKALGELDVFSEQRVAALFKHILLGVKYLHSKGVVHRDLKMDNLLYSKDEEGNVTPKITDFGLSAITIKREESSAKQSKQLHTLKDMWGTAEYFAPEVYRRAYGFQADIWALGCLLFEMLTGEIAFPYRERMVSFADRVFFYGLKKPVRPFELKAGWKTLSPSVQSLIKGMLKTDPTKRFDIDECLRHPWITGPHPAAQCVELKESRKIIRERLDRKAKRYEAAVREMEREKVHASIIAKQ